MAQKSKIEWTQSTWNPWHGCIKVSPGCKNCYMYRDKNRFGQDPKLVSRSKTTFRDPLKWHSPTLIFTCSWSDWFIEEADEWRDDAWDVIRKTPHHTYQILTKRPERVLETLPRDWGKGWSNVWLGVSVENQKYEPRLDLLRRVPAKVRFVSAEPLLAPIKFRNLKKIDWLITGGESGPGARPMDMDWVRSIRDQCKKAKVAFFHKQNGGTTIVDGAWGGRKVDGRTWDAMPNLA
ncbi:MAG: phage Gp37/Gp68 family protein [Anaerolineales bacterium]|nr:phage Gp37/Gp68 family protein [Anaerolineales bacterium]